MNRFRISVGYTFVSFVLLTSLVTGCGGKQEKEGSASSYKESKQMVIDILKTKEGQKAIKEAMKGSRSSSGQGGDGGEEMKIQAHDMMQDPKFASSMAKAMKEENQKLLKDLMKDPEYQKMMLNIMKDPEYQKMVLETMKSPTYRQQTMTVMKEAMQSPIFQLEMINIAHKAQVQMIKPEQGKETGKGGQKQGGQGGQGGGGGKGGGGGGGK
jgi:spore germination protein D